VINTSARHWLHYFNPMSVRQDIHHDMSGKEQNELDAKLSTQALSFFQCVVNAEKYTG